MNVILFKIAAILLIICGGLVGGILPLKISLSERGKKLLSLGNAFAGGIFLGAGLIHMLPDANENFKIFMGDVDYPFAFLICGLGFLLVLFLEKVLVRGKAIKEMTEGRIVYPFILLLVLSIHSIIVGISLGLEKTLISSAIIFIAIIAHKSSAAFALGVSMKKSLIPSRRFIGIIVFFSFMTPLGIIFGVIFSQVATGMTSTQIEGIFDALAAGTFIYIAVMDIIQEVFEKSENRWLKFMLVVISFSFMALIAIWA